MEIGFCLAPERGDADRLLAGVAETLVAQGLRVCGIVQVNTLHPDRSRCDMDIAVLPRGPVIRISQTLGAGAGACRLDAGALETAVALVAASLDRGADVLILNKFGKQEAVGRGFHGLIAEAVAQGVPVLLRVNHRNMPAFQAFSAGFATALAPDAGQMIAWLDHIRRGRGPGDLRRTCRLPAGQGAALAGGRGPSSGMR